MVEKESKKVNLIWYILPAIEIIGFFWQIIKFFWQWDLLPSWLWFFAGFLTFFIWIASTVSIIGFLFIRKKSLSVALINLIVGIIGLRDIILFMFYFIKA